MALQRWQGGKEWEEVKPLGKGGQSQVYLVRGSERIAERKRYLGKLKEVTGLRFDDARAEQFVEATLGYGREERPAELGALKVYNPRAAGEAAEQQARARLRIEINVLLQNRSGLPKLLDHNVSEGWVVTEYFPGGTLEDHLSSYAGNAFLSLTAFHSLVETVAALHIDDIVHRDIKPANIFVAHDGKLILGDFGIAFLPNLPERVTFTNESVGPRDYMPPWAETEERLEKVKGQFDVYELGKVLWCMVAGRLKLVREWYAKPEFDLRVKFPHNPQMHIVNAILEKCLNEDPRKCLAGARDLLLMLRAYLEVMRRGGQALDEGIPRPCRVCGYGFYQPSGGTSGQVIGLPVGVSTGNPGSWRHEGALYARIFVCDKCGNVEFFKTT